MPETKTERRNGSLRITANMLAGGLFVVFMGMATWTVYTTHNLSVRMARMEADIALIKSILRNHLPITKMGLGNNPAGSIVGACVAAAVSPALPNRGNHERRQKD